MNSMEFFDIRLLSDNNIGSDPGQLEKTYLNNSFFTLQQLIFYYCICTMLFIAMEHCAEIIFTY